MIPSIETRRGARGSRARLLLVFVGLAMGCEAAPDSTGGETHFLRACDLASECGGGLSCLCGFCTRSCAGPANCGGLTAAECVAPTASGLCGGAAPQTFCDALCQSDGQCAAQSADHRCVDGRCRAGASGAPATGGVGGVGGVGGATACPSGEVGANQVVILGDRYFGATHQVTAYLEDQARGSGAIAVGERYRDLSAIIGNALALGGNGIAAQYAQAAAEAAVEVVIMNGGGADVLGGSCATPTPDCPLLVDASAGAEALLSRMAADGVGHVVYAFYPDPVDLEVRAKMDALRPLIEAVCQASPVPCHWVDLRPTFVGFYPEYVQPDGITPTAAGSQASAAAIWQAMQANCIAQ